MRLINCELCIRGGGGAVEPSIPNNLHTANISANERSNWADAKETIHAGAREVSSSNHKEACLSPRHTASSRLCLSAHNGSSKVLQALLWDHYLPHRASPCQSHGHDNQLSAEIIKKALVKYTSRRWHRRKYVFTEGWLPFGVRHGKLYL